MKTGFFCIVIGALTFLGAMTANAAVSILGKGSASDNGNDTEFTFSADVPAGTQLALIGVTNRDDRAVSNVHFTAGDTRAFIPVVDSEASGMDERAAWLYFKNPPIGAASISVTVSGNSAHKAAAILFLDGVNLDAFSAPGASAPLLPTAKSTGGNTGVSTLSFTGAEAPVGALALSAATCRTRDLAVQTVAGVTQTEQWNLETAYVLTYQSHGGSTAPGSLSGTTFSWNNGGNWGLAAVVIPPANQGALEVSTPTLTVGDAAPNGTSAGTLSVTDPDGVAPYTWTLTNDAAGRFALSAATGASVNVVVANEVLIDRGQAASHVIHIRVQDSSVFNQPYEADLTVQVTDTTQPVVSAISAVPAVIRDGSTTAVTATVADNVGLSGLPAFTVNGTAGAAPTVSGNQYTAQWQAPAGSAEGPATISVSAVDAAGNTGAGSSATALVIDNTPPRFSNFSVSAPYVKPGDTLVASVTATDDHGVAAAPALLVNGLDAGVPATDGDHHTWTYVLPADTPEGPLTLLVRAFDTPGNEGTGNASDMVTVDATPPSISNLFSSVAWARTGTQVTITATVSDSEGLSGLPVLRFNNGSLTMPQALGDQYAWTFTVSAAEPSGPAQIYVDATDQAGNSATGSPPSTILTVDQAAPGIGTPTINPTSATIGTVVTVTSAVSDDFGLAALPQLTLNGVVMGAPSESSGTFTWTFPVPSGQPEGTASMQILAGDRAGNTNSLSSSGLTIDPNAPVISGVSVLPTPAKAVTLEIIKVNITDLSGLSGDPTLYINGKLAVYTGVTGTQHSWRHWIPSTGPEGWATLEFRAADVWGNTRTLTVTDALFIDRIAPQIADIQVSPNLAKGGDVVRIFFNAIDGGTGVSGTPTVTVNGVAAAYQSRTGDRFEYRITMRPTEPDGNAAISISARDVVGNAGTGSSSSLLVDNSLPTVSEVSVYPRYARDNTEVRIGFRVNDANGLQSLPVVSVNGRPAAHSADEAGHYEYVYAVHRGTDTEGPASVEISATDTTGHTGTSQSGGLLHIDTLPPAGTMVVNGGTLVTRISVLLMALFPDDGALGSGVSEMSVSEDGESWQAWVPYAQSKVVEVAPGMGWRTVYARLRDRAGNENAQPLSCTVALKPYQLAVDQESPARVTAGTGAAVVLEISARNVFGHVVSYEWRKNGVPLPPEAGVSNGPALALDNLSLDDAGSYTCVVADEVESKESVPFVLEVEQIVPSARAAGLLVLAALLALAAAAVMGRAGRRGAALLTLLLALGLPAAVPAWAEVAVVSSAQTQGGSLSDDALRALAVEKGSVEIWTRKDDGKVKRELSRLGEPGVGNPGFTTMQREEMDRRAAAGARKTIQKDGSSLVVAELGQGASLVFSQPKRLGGPTFDARLMVDGEAVWTEQRWEETVGGVTRPLFIRIDFARGSIAQVFEYTNNPPVPLPPVYLRKEGPAPLPDGMQPVSLPAEKADTVSRDVQFIVPTQGLSNLGFDSGWVPGGTGPDPGGFIIQVRLAATAGFNYDAAVNGQFSLADGNMLGIGPASGNWGFYFGAHFFLKAAFDIPPILGWDLDPFTVDIPYVPEFNYVASDRENFNSWLLGGVTSTLHNDAVRQNVVNLDILSLLITQGVLPSLPSWLPLPSVGVKLDVGAIADGTMTCNNVGLSDGTKYISEGQIKPINVPQAGYRTMATYNDVTSLNVGVKFFPGVYFSWLGFRWDWPVEGVDENILTRLEWLPIALTDFPFTSPELNFTGIPSPGDPSDWFTQQFTFPDVMDLGLKRIRFTPNFSNNYYIACAEDPVSSYRTSLSGATALPLGNNQFVKVDLADGRRVPLYGKYYSSIYVGSNGYITFDSGDTSADVSLEHHFNQPRISALLTGLQIASGGKVYFQQLPNRVVVTWDRVCINSTITTQTDSMQVEMFFDGRIVITWLQLDSYYPLAGLSRGGGVPAKFAESDLSRYGGCLSGIVEEGGVRVNFTPPGVLAQNPRWRLDNSGDWLPGGAVASATLGAHTVSFNYLPNLWATPTPLPITVSLADVTSTYTVDWTRLRGTIKVNVQPQAASWSLVDGDGVVHTGTGSLDMPNMPTGTCAITWMDLPTWTKPSPATQELFLYPNSEAAFTGNYAPIIGEGRATLTVNLDPEAARLAGARWRFNGGDWQEGGATLTIPDGDATITFLDLPGWDEPATITQFFTRDTVTTLSAEYTREKGTVIIDVEPNSAAWTLTDGDGAEHAGTGDTTLADLPTGAVAITWSPLPAYNLPDPNPNTFVLEKGATVRVTGAYQPIIGEGEGILRVTIQPGHAVSAGAQWRLIGGEWNSSGAMLAVKDGEHTVKFLDLDGWVTPDDQTVNVIRDITNDVSATYTRRTGTVVVDVTPNNATWVITDADGDTHNGAGDATLENMPTGPLTVIWGGLTGYATPTPNPGNYTVEEGATLTLTGAYILAVLTADFTASPTAGAFPLEVRFTDLSTSTTKPVQQWTWYFGDGKTSTERNPEHVYRVSGVYTVTLSVSTADQMAMETKKQFINVEPAVPAAGLAGLAGLALATAAAGVRLLRRRR